ncbi:MAG TPA: C4-dicarboxylate ABC transporter [Gammaproteobacteria bacterium]|nr:C4-dicarboxylate ABC transporter [Gammaproteobacteria bacterium]
MSGTPLLRWYSHILIAVLLGLALPVQAVDLKIATLVPDGTLWMKEMRKGADEVTQRTGGRVNFRFYPGGSMGNDRSVLRKIRAGQLQGGALTGGSLSDIEPNMQLYSLPFLFRSNEEFVYVRSRMDKAFIEGLEKNGFVTFGLGDGGVAYLMSNTMITKVDDLKTQKVWIPEGDDVLRDIFVSLGVSPVPLPLTDVLTGLQTGLVTAVGTSAVGAIALQWHTKVKYVTDVPTLYLYGALAVDKKAFDRISAADQKVLREVMERVFADLSRQTRLDDRSAREALKKQGIQFVKMPPEEVAKLQSATENSLERLGKNGTFNSALLRQIREHLAIYRRNPSAAH